MKRITITVLAVLLLSNVNSFSQDAKQIRANFDWAVFQSQQQPFLEFYYSFPKMDLHYIKKADSFQGLFLGKLHVFHNDSVVNQFAWKNESVVTDTSVIQDRDLLIDQLRFELPPGEYRAEFTLEDLNNPENKDIRSFQFNIGKAAKEFSASDLELASSIRRSEAKESPFYKNTLFVVPHPSLIYNKSVPMLFFYSELYNLPGSFEANYEIQHKILDKTGEPVKKVKPVVKSRDQAVHPQVEYGFMNVGKLSSGIYQLALQVYSDGELIGEKTKEFYVYQMDEKAPDRKSVV